MNLQNRRGTFLVRESETTKGKRTDVCIASKAPLPFSIYNDILNLGFKGHFLEIFNESKCVTFNLNVD